MIGALHSSFADSAGLERGGPMRADITQREEATFLCPAKKNRFAAQHLAPHGALTERGRKSRHVPEVRQEKWFIGQACARASRAAPKVITDAVAKRDSLGRRLWLNPRFRPTDSPMTNRWLIVLASALSHMVGQGAINVFAGGVFIAPIAMELGIGRGVMSSAFGLSSIMTAVTVPILGRLIDRFGVRTILLPSIV